MDPVTQAYKYLCDVNTRHGVETPSNRFRPSEISGCARAIFYRMRGGSARGKGTPSLAARDGDILHDDLRFILRDAGVELDWLEFDDISKTVLETKAFKHPVEIDGEDYIVSGRCDGKIKVDGEWMPLEIKTLNGFGFKYVNAAYNKGEIFEYLEKKYPKYLDQCMLCADSLGYDKTYLIIKDRSSGQFGVYDVANKHNEGGIIIKNDPERLARMYKKMAAIAKSLKADVEPPRAYVENSRECGWCDYKSICWGK